MIAIEPEDEMISRVAHQHRQETSHENDRGHNQRGPHAGERVLNRRQVVFCPSFLFLIHR